MTFDRKQFDKIVDRTQTWSVKWDSDYMIERFGRDDLLPFNHAELDFECPLPIIEAVQKRAEHGIYGYTLVKEEYYDAIIRWFKTRHDVEFLTEDLLYSTGVISSYRQVIPYFSNPGDKVLLFTPVYKPLSEAIYEYERKPVTFPLSLEGKKYRIDFDALEKTFQKLSIKVLSMCNPHNPVGRVWTEKELKKIGDLCLEHNILIVSDDIHCDLTAKGHKYIPFCSISEELAMNSIILTSMTKTFNSSGLKIANIHIKNPELRRNFFEMLNKKFVYAPSVFGISALISAYSLCGGWADLLVEYLDANFRYIDKFIEENNLNISVTRREGTPTAWLDFRKLPLPANKVHNFLVNKASLILVDGSYYTANGEGFQRMSIGFPRSRIKLAMKQMKMALNTL
ncbi:MAG: putative C-S lyase [Candidatus Lokiarchaeota archaeon]|nr:putative C-S lyase [Candidatus Lokiarchaeota archaeon]MBD3339691.1 putative C-S lyase [Candidatus Lokiarchaeota archaeon]